MVCVHCDSISLVYIKNVTLTDFSLERYIFGKAQTYQSGF